MKTELLILICIIGLMLTAPGCKQVIREDTELGHRLKINTLFMNSGFESFRDDPNGVFEVSKYKGLPSNIELVYDPITHEFKIITKASE